MKKFVAIIFTLSFHHFVFSQKVMEQDNAQLKEIELKIRPYADSMIYAEDWINRFRADSFFTRGFVQALKIKNSFYYSFDSIKTFSQLYSPDSSFKIFTWQLMKDFSYYRQKGAIQLKTNDGSLKLFPLFDFSEFTTAPNDSVRDARHWIGAIYYKITLKTFGNKNYYTLIGSDENDERTNKKWIEVLWFDENNQPHFGGKFFSYPANDLTKPKAPVYRFVLEYKKDGGARMNYDPFYDAIIFSHLTSESDDINNKSTLIPYGDYEGFRWINGKWVFVDDPFKGFESKSSQRPPPLLDEKGNFDEKRLMEQSKKNQQKVPIQLQEDPNKINEKKKQCKAGENGNY
jgi:hypothetical protein